MKKIFSLLILSIHMVSFGLAQDYQWPLKLDKSLSSNFGEYRPRRFHAGIDIKTKGTTGHEILAVSDGYISRIKVSSGGYGKVLYLKLNDGNTAVYAHLNAFIPVLNAIVKLEQNRQNTYSIEKYFGENELPVQKGDLIGYTGE
ncbi:MAG: M23 family metallopeptidase, partial [Candidatus Marinimicrobia bacterium]|nr:M23 family metallopeptidase [Candidatus Neomarinimicrobiota bacterium]